MPIQYFEQFHQRDWRLGLAAFVSGECVDKGLDDQQFAVGSRLTRLRN